MLNGNRYDASTGEQLDATSTSKKRGGSPIQSKNIDGFIQKSPRRTAIKPNLLSRQVAKSKTLMRTAVSKPSLSTRQSEKSQSKTIEHSSAQPDPIRQRRAIDTKRSQLISRFGGEMKKLTKYSHVPITAEPQKTKPVTSAHSTKIITSKQHDTSTRPDNIEAVMKTATSHQKTKLKRTSRGHKLAHRLKISPSLLQISALVFVALVLVGYFAYNNVPNLAMRVASTRSGIKGSLPGYSPAGFSMNGPIKYQTGQITLNFNSNSDDRKYTVTEQNSEWNSEALLENHVAANKRAYQTFQEKGKTIYMYDGDSASWVDQGIWYEVSGNTSLNTDQVLRIANSL